MVSKICLKFFVPALAVEKLGEIIAFMVESLKSFAVVRIFAEIHVSSIFW